MSRSASTFFFNSTFSIMASMTRSAVSTPSFSRVLVFRLFKAMFLSSSLMVSFLIWRSRLRLMVSIAFSRAFWDISIRLTWYHLRQKICAIPLPIVPDPIIEMFLMNLKISNIKVEKWSK